MNSKLNIKGVNLGNWLVLEKWMCPSMFEGTGAEDEYYLARELTHEIYEERIRRHRKEYITERDFAAIAHMGMNAVRIPVPYFIFGDREPFVGCIEELDNAFDWAERWGLKILIDLHTVPWSQNGFDNGGLCGVCKWSQMSEEVEFVLVLLEKLAERYGKRDGLFGIQPLNEPLTSELLKGQPWEESFFAKNYPPRDSEMAKGSKPADMEFLRKFYEDAYRLIRKHVKEEAWFVFHDAFCITAWKDFMQDAVYKNVALDSHMYLSGAEYGGCEKSLEGYKRALQEGYGKNIEEMSQYFPVICGEWCLDNSYAKELEEPKRRDEVYRALAQEQLDTWEKGAGYFYWSYKLMTDVMKVDCWDLGKSVYHGWFPERV